MPDHDVLDIIFNSNVEYRKYIAALFIIFALPSLLNFITTVYKNRTTSKLIKSFEATTAENTNNIHLITQHVNDLYKSKFVEGTITQILFSFSNRVIHDIETLIKDTKRLIIINHIDNRDITREKLFIYTSNVFNKSRNAFKCFERNNIPVGDFFNPEWIVRTAAIIEEFIYNSRIDTENNDKPIYNYDILKSRLKTHYETITVEFEELINNPKN